MSFLLVVAAVDVTGIGLAARAGAGLGVKGVSEAVMIGMTTDALSTVNSDVTQMFVKDMGGSDRAAWISGLAAGFATGAASDRILGNSLYNTVTNINGGVFDDVVEIGDYSSLRDIMTPEQIALYDKYWINIAERTSDEAIDNQIAFIKSGGITKPSGGIYRPAKVSATVDLNNGEIYFGYNGTSGFNPSRIDIMPDLQARIEYTKELASNSKGNIFANKASFEIWSVDNCAEINSANNALHNGASLDNIFINTKNFKDGIFAPPCKNCQITFKGVNMPEGR